MKRTIIAAAVLALGAAGAAAGAKVLVVAPHLGLLMSEQRTPVPAAKALLTAQSVEFDAVVIAGGSEAATPRAMHLIIQIVLIVLVTRAIPFFYRKNTSCIDDQYAAAKSRGTSTRVRISHPSWDFHEIWTLNCSSRWCTVGIEVLSRILAK